MIQKIIDGTIAAIATEYDESFRKYTESVEQGLTAPCFSILCLSVTDKQEIGIRRYRGYLLNISYFPSSAEPVAECLAVMENLYDLLSMIDVGDSKVRGTDMTGMVVDGVLQFQVTYAPFLLSEETEDIGMDGIEVNTNGRE